MIDLDNLRKLEAAATPGPWIHDLDDTHYVRHHHVRHPNGWQTLALTNLNHHDAALIAAMRNALPALLADHARLVAEAALATDLAYGAEAIRLRADLTTERSVYARYVQRGGHDEARAIANIAAAAWPVFVAAQFAWATASLLVCVTRPVLRLIAVPLAWAWRLGEPAHRLPKMTATETTRE